MKLNSNEKEVIRERRAYKARRLRAFRKLRRLVQVNVKFGDIFWELRAC